MATKQPKIPGLEAPQSSEEQLPKLAERVLKLELEVSLLRILVDNPKDGDKELA